jgi:hypothetical protein
MGKKDSFLLFFSSGKYFWVHFLHALGTNAMAKIRLGVIHAVFLDLMPVTVVISAFLAGSTNGQ